MKNNNWFSDIEKWNQELIENNNKEQRKKQFREWGKLGGRPKKYEQKKSEKILLALTKMQKEKLKRISHSFGIKPQELIRNIISDLKPKDAERNKILVEYRTNFKRISNHFKSNVWTPSEKEKYKRELEYVISMIEKELRK